MPIELIIGTPVPEQIDQGTSSETSQRQQSYQDSLGARAARQSLRNNRRQGEAGLRNNGGVPPET